MQPDSSHSAADRVPWLPSEAFRFAFDAKEGLLDAPTPSAALTVTSHRVIALDRRAGRRATTIAPLGAVSAVEVTEASRPVGRLWQGLAALGAGLLLAWVTWALFSAALITVIVGGLPILASVYILLDFVLPNAKGELTLHTPGASIRCPLQSNAAQQDAYAAAHRIVALQAGIDDLSGTRQAPDAEDAEPVDAPPDRRRRRARRRPRREIRAMRRIRSVRHKKSPRLRKPEPPPRRQARPPLRGAYARRLRRHKVGGGARRPAGSRNIGARALAITSRGLPAAERLARRILRARPV